MASQPSPMGAGSVPYFFVQRKAHRFQMFPFRRFIFLIVGAVVLILASGFVSMAIRGNSLPSTVSTQVAHTDATRPNLAIIAPTATPATAEIIAIPTLTLPEQSAVAPAATSLLLPVPSAVVPEGAALDYLRGIGEKGDRLFAALEQITDLLAQPLPNDLEWSRQLRGAIDEIVTIHSELAAINPPKEYANFQLAFTDAAFMCIFFDGLFPAYEMGTYQVDMSRTIETAQNLMPGCYQGIADAMYLLPPTPADVTYLETISNLLARQNEPILTLTEQIDQGSEDLSLINNSEWLSTTNSAIDALRTIANEYRMVTVPFRFEDMHLDLLAMADHYERSLDLLTTFLDTTSADVARQAADEMQLAGMSMRDALAKLLNFMPR